MVAKREDADGTKIGGRSVDVRDIQLDALRSVLAFGMMECHDYGIYHFVFHGELIYGKTFEVVKLLGTWTVSMFFDITAYRFAHRLMLFLLVT